jgi:hypothetical protein
MLVAVRQSPVPAPPADDLSAAEPADVLGGRVPVQDSTLAIDEVHSVAHLVQGSYPPRREEF